MIFILGDYADVDLEFVRLDAMPTLEMKAGLALVLETGFVETNAATHIETGSLKSSEKQEFETHNGIWTGKLEFGGPSLGVHNPVDYAIYEQRRGGLHDFMSPMKVLGPLWVTAIEIGLR